MTDSVFIVSDAHRDMMRQLERRGIELIEEEPFPPYQVDIYIPDFHVCVEVDGPQHGKRADAKRDATLEQVYSLPTFRVKAKNVNRPDKWAVDLAMFLRRHAPTARERREACSLKVS